MRYSLISLILLMGLFSGCQKNGNLNRQVKDRDMKNEMEMLRNKPNIMNGAVSDIKSMILNYRDKQSPKNQKQISVDKEKQEFIFKALDNSMYDESQYDEEKNPGGIMLKVVENDFTVTIEYKNGKNDTVFVWKTRGDVKINGKWYVLEEEYKRKLPELLENLEKRAK